MHRDYTLLVSLDDLLVTSTWDVRPTVSLPSDTRFNLSIQRKHGWRTAKRPGVDYFLAYLSQFYEIVIFTTQYHYVSRDPTEVLHQSDPSTVV